MTREREELLVQVQELEAKSELELDRAHALLQQLQQATEEKTALLEQVPYQFRTA